MIPVTAHRMVVPHRGDPDVMQWISAEVPEPEANEVRVRVEAAGVSAYDVMLRGHRFPGFPAVPYTPGEDFVGIVDKVGHGVRDVHVGQRVGGWTFGDGGCYAAYLCRPAADMVPVPDGLAPDIAVSLIVNCLTASLALHQAAKAKTDEWLLVQGAGGGLGSAILQLGRAAGLRTIGCDSAEKHEQIRADGAMPIDFRTENVAQRTRDISDGGADLVIDLVGGGRQLLRSWRALRPRGRLFMLGMAGALRSGTGIILPSLALAGLFMMWPGHRRLVSGPGMETYPREHPGWYRDAVAGFFAMAQEGRLNPHIAARIPIANAAKAHRMLESGQTAGKIVLVRSTDTSWASSPSQTTQRA